MSLDFEHVARLREVWICDPSAFAVDVLDFDPWDDGSDNSQRAILKAVPYNRRISVRSGHKVGKSASAAVIALWGWSLLPDCRVVLTAPVFAQVRNVLWREIRRFYARARFPLGDLEWCAQSPGTGLTHPVSGNQIFGKAISTPEAFSGISGKNVIYIVDEASGVPEEIFEAIEGNRAGGAWLILFSNPTQVTGTFYDSHTSRASAWKTFHVDSARVAETVNASGRLPLASPEWLEEKREEWGESSPEFAVRVRGDFPDTSEANVFSLSVLEQAMARSERAIDVRDGSRFDRVVVGLDVARFGSDETVAFARQGKRVFGPLVLRGLSGPQVATEVKRWLETEIQGSSATAFKQRAPVFYVDAIGVGASVVDSLNALGEEVVAVNVSEKAHESERYANVRAEMAFATLQWLKDGGSMPRDDRLKADLLAFRYSFDLRGRYRLESKDEMRKRLGRSPDRGDAFCLACYAAAVPTFDNRPVRLKALSL